MTTHARRQARGVSGRANRRRTAFLSASSALALTFSALTPAVGAEEAVTFEIDEQPLSSALIAFSDQARVNVVASSDIVIGKTAPAIAGEMAPAQALDILLADTGLRYTIDDTGSVTVEGPGAELPQPSTVLAQAETGGTSTGRTREKIIVTGQKREEYIQDVPIAISAFSQEDLTTAQIAGGPDLVTQIPNFTFTKTNFSGYSIQIRGIGTQAISATTDPAVAVAFNNTPFIRNRFFEQEFYDMERVEVLRGPQGTLYGRNATAGVVNLISAKPLLDEDEARFSLDLGNFNSRRLEGMVNIPLVDDQLALRIAGAWTDRDGYATNQITGNPIDGRDLWSTRLSLGFQPNDRLRGNLIWEHFEEDDDRLRSGKQVCSKDVVSEIGGVSVPTGGGQTFSGPQANFSQGCKRTSLYDTGDPLNPDDNGAYETPNGYMLPYYLPLSAIFLPAALDSPYSSEIQSSDLRVIESTVDPNYEARTDIVEIQFDFDLTDTLTLTSETSWFSDFIFSKQDFNRFNTEPGAWEQTSSQRDGVLEPGPFGGIFCDPQLGCSDRLVGVDVSTANSSQFSQELRLASSYAGAFNFSVGGNFLRYDTIEKYYVFFNSLSLIAAISPYGGSHPPYVGGETDNLQCMLYGPLDPDFNTIQGIVGCTYMDPNPIGGLNDKGHNYFLSNNPFKLLSYAAFGEAYWNLTDNLKLTGGLRWTVDKKEAPRIPSWILAGDTVGYPVATVIKQEWREPTGRLTLDWKPDLGFTDETLLYASYAHGYKAGGANPPPAGAVQYCPTCGSDAFGDAAVETSVTHPRTFDPEYIDAFEIGSKNTFADGDVTLNLAAFYYDYEGYQVSEIVNRSAVNSNYDAEVWGLEIEAEWWALENLRLSFKGGYEKTRIADGEQAIDLMDRTAGNEDWQVVKPFPTNTSNCILPVYTIVWDDNAAHVLGNVSGGTNGGCETAYQLGLDPVTNQPYVANPTVGKPALYPSYIGFNPETAPNNGEGFFKDLGGNELPNAPNYTATLSADYILPLGTEWTLTFHTDLYYQSEAWWRVFNDHEFSRLNEYYTMNLAAILKSEDGWNVMGYVKNVTDETAITGAFLYSDDTGLTTNLFLTDPRLYGVRITKDWTGGTFLGGLIDGERRDPDKPYPWNLKIGGQIQRWDAPNEGLEPSFVGAFRPELDVFGEAPDPELDWGDGRDVEVSYRPNGGAWKVSAGVRFGKTNGEGQRVRAEDDSDTGCAFGGAYSYYCYYLQYLYDLGYYPTSPYFSLTDWAYADPVRQREEHEIVDFAVGRDVGVGGLSQSTLSLGARYAQFKSRTTNANFDGIPDWYLPDGFLIPGNYYFPNYLDAGWAITHSRRMASLSAFREFEGAGPILSWEAALPLFGNSDTGVVDVNWSVSGGALFGKQKTSISGTEDYSYYDATAPITVSSGNGGNWTPPAYTAPTTYVDIERSQDVTVPVAGASLGFSYRIDRYSFGAGYRWERYYDVLDGGGTDEAKDLDRTIDGPYFNVSIGFGG